MFEEQVAQAVPAGCAPPVLAPYGLPSAVLSRTAPFAVLGCLIQQLLGHEKLETAAIYTEVSVEQLKAVHAKTHPAESGRDKPSQNV